MRVLHVVAGIGPGGAEKLTEDLIAVNSQQGVAHAVAVLKGVATEGPLRKPQLRRIRSLQQLGADVSVLDVGSRSVTRSASKLRGYLNEVDLVHAHSYTSALAAGMALHQARPVLWTMHSTRMGVPRPATLMTRPWIDHYVACSTSVERAFGRLCGHRLTTILNGIDIKRFVEAATARAPRDPSGVRFLAVGGMRAAKNYPRMVDAFVTAHRTFANAGITARLTIVGDGTEFEMVRKAVRARRAESYIHLAGHHDDVAPFMQAADIFLSSSDREGLPIAALEAVAAGLSVIATPLPVMVDLAGQGLPVTVASAYSPIALSDAIVAETSRLTEAPSRSPQVEGQLEQFSIETCAAAYRALYERLLSERAH